MLQDILLKNVLLHDVETGKTAKKPQDILIDNGIVSAIGEGLAGPKGCEVIDCGGSYATVGWIDAHTHLGNFDIMRTYPPDGVTYAFDAGSTGALNYAPLRRKMAASPLRTKTYLYVSKVGVGGKDEKAELRDPSNLDPVAFKECYEKYPNDLLGVKIRIDPRVNSDTMGTLKRAQEIAVSLNLPLIVHPSRCEHPLEEVLAVMKKGDIYAHSYASLTPCIIDENGQVKACAREARERGIWFDLAHGTANFSYDVARKAIEQDFVVDAISTDLHAGNVNGPVRCMADTMSKMLHVGLSLPEVLKRVTVTPLAMLGITDKDTAITVGRMADITVFDVLEGQFELTDSTKVTETCARRIQPKVTIIGATIHYPRTEVYTTGDY